MSVTRMTLAGAINEKTEKRIMVRLIVNEVRNSKERKQM